MSNTATATNRASAELTEKALFNFQMQIVIADTLKMQTEYLLLDESAKQFIRQDIKQAMSDMNKALSLYATRINGRDTALIGECGQFADTLLDFLNNATKNEQRFQEVFGLMSAYNNGEITITE